MALDTSDYAPSWLTLSGDVTTLRRLFAEAPGILSDIAILQQVSGSFAILPQPRIRAVAS